MSNIHKDEEESLDRAIEFDKYFDFYLQHSGLKQIIDFANIHNNDLIDDNLIPDLTKEYFNGNYDRDKLLQIAGYALVLLRR